MFRYIKTESLTRLYYKAEGRLCCLDRKASSGRPYHIVEVHAHTRRCPGQARSLDVAAITYNNTLLLCRALHN